MFENGKRYNTLDGFFKKKFGCKIAKITLNGGFSCPNRDGTKSHDGCIYCSEKLSGDFAGNPDDSIETQLEKGKQLISSKWKNVKYMPYFQAGSNTYAPIEKLKSLYEPALAMKDAVGLSIATRPDCISNATLEYLDEINKRTFLTVELGLQSVFDKTGDILFYLDGFEIVGLTILKKTEEERKICTFLINEDYRKKGYSKKLMEDAFLYLGTDKPIITIPEKRIKEFQKIIDAYNFIQTSTINDYYSEEYVFNENQKMLKICK